MNRIRGFVMGIRGNLRFSCMSFAPRYWVRSGIMLGISILNLYSALFFIFPLSAFKKIFAADSAKDFD
jgi:hypothetical protein